MEIYPLDIAMHIVNIVVLYLILRLLVFKPVRKFMLARTARIQKQLDSAEATYKAAEEMKSDYEGKIAGVEEEVRQIINVGHLQAMDDAENIVSDAKTRATQIVSSAKSKAEADTQKAVIDMREEIVEAAVDMAGRILKREVGIKENGRIVDDFFAGFSDKNGGSIHNE